VENSPLEQYNRILEAANHPYRFTEKDAYEIAKESYSLGTGARGINNIMEERLNKLLSYSNNDFKKLKEE
jgi:ATP-dependent protease Clp ATPase subunit